jgi:flagella basal body P-ring formation protein FlgA
MSMLFSITLRLALALAAGFAALGQSDWAHGAPRHETDCPAPADVGGIAADLHRLVLARVSACALVEISAADVRFLAAAPQGSITLTNLEVNPEFGTFSVIAVGGETRTPGGRATRMIHGRVAYAQKIPVLTRRVMPGESITPDDIQMTAMDARRIPANAITNLAEMIGLEVKWPAQPFAPLTKGQLRPAVLVERGDVITAEFKSNNLELTVRVVALESGGRGQTIRLQNADSNKTLRGRIVDVARVSIE